MSFPQRGRDDEFGHLPSQGRFTRVAERLLCRGVELDDPPLVIDGDDAFIGRLDNGPHAGLTAGQFGGPLLDHLFELTEREFCLSRQLPLFRQRAGQLADLDDIERLLQNQEAVRLADLRAHFVPRVVGIRRAEDNLQLRVLRPDVLDSFDSVPSRRHTNVYKRHRVGTFITQGLLDHFQALLPLKSGIDVERFSLRLVQCDAEKGGFGKLGLIGGVAAVTENLVEIRMNGLVIVNDEDARGAFGFYAVSIAHGVTSVVLRGSCRTKVAPVPGPSL